MHKDYRSFTVLTKNHGGRFISKTPDGAAKKAYSSLKCKTTCDIKIQETTQGSKKKIYEYRVKRIKNNQVVDFKGGDEVVFKYIIKTKSLN